MQFNTIFVTLAALAASLMCAIANAADQCLEYPDQFPFMPCKEIQWSQIYDKLTPDELYEFKVNPQSGTPPFSWSVEGEGLSVVTSGTVGEVGTVTVTSLFCTPAKVVVLDSCGKKIDHLVTSGTGRWVQITEAEWPEGLVVYGDFIGPSVVGQNEEYKAMQRYGGVQQTENIEQACTFAAGNPRYKTYAGYNGTWWTNCEETNSIYRIQENIPGLHWRGAWPIQYGLTLFKWECTQQ